MNNLEMSESKCKKLDELEDAAITVLLDAIKGNQEFNDKVKVSMQVLNAVGKNRQTLSHRQAVGFAIAKAVMTEDELRKYAEVTAPEIKKMLKP